MTDRQIGGSALGRAFRVAATGLDGLNAIVRGIIGALLAVATLAIAAQVFVRFVLSTMGWNVSAPWTEEVARYAMIWAVFLGVGAISRNAALISVEMLPQLLPRRIGFPLRIFALLITVGFFLFVLCEGYHFTLEGAWETSPVLRLKMHWVHLAIPVGAALAVVNLLVFIIECLFCGRDPIAIEDIDVALD